MSNEQLFCHLSSDRIAELIRAATHSVCYAAPGIQKAPALAIAEAAGRLGPEMITVSLDFDQRVLRMGYGDIDAVRVLRQAGVVINHAPGLRSALVIVDQEGYTFTPTPLYLEAESGNEHMRNALRLSRDQVLEALARLSPAAKAIAVAGEKGEQEQERIRALPVEVNSDCVDDSQFEDVDNNLKAAPPVKFDLARQVHVFEPYLQYVELKLKGAAIQRRRLTIPPTIQRLGGDRDLEGRLRTTFDLIASDDELSSRHLEDALKEIRENFTPSLGNPHGRVVLKSVKPHLESRIASFRETLEDHREKVGEALQDHLDESRRQIIDYYLPLVLQSPPDAVLGQSLRGEVTEEGARCWLDAELNRVFPTADSLVGAMDLDEYYRDVTYETLKRSDFLNALKKAFPQIDWDKAHEEFIAAGESESDG